VSFDIGTLLKGDEKMVFGFGGGAKKRAAELYEAAQKGDLDGVRQALDKGADINALDPECSETALHAAVDKSQKAVAEYLLSKGANPDIVSGQHLTPLIIAATMGEVALPMVESLLAGKANPELAPTTGPNAGLAPMHIAASNGSNAILTKLLATGAKPEVPPNGFTLLHMAAIGGNAETVEIGTKTGISVDCTDSQARTPLHLTALTGNSAVARKLLELGAAVDKRDGEDSTPLMHAALQNKPNVADLLLKKGANPDVVATNGDSVMSPLYGAAINGFDGIVKLLLAAGVPADKKIGEFQLAADMAKQAGHESTAALLKKSAKQKKAAAVEVSTEDKSEELLQAVMEGSLAHVKKLISKGANPNYVNTDGQCALTLALSCMMLEDLPKQVRSNLRKTFDYLLENGADVNISGVDTAPLGIAVYCGVYFVEEILKRNADVDVQLLGMGTPLLAASGDSNLEECALALIAAGASLDEKSQNGQTALHGAAVSGQSRVVKAILNNRPDLMDMADDDGATPIILATKSGHKEIVQILLKAGAVSPTEKLSRLRELIRHPIVQSTIPAETHAQVGDLLNQIDEDGIDSVSDNVVQQLLQLAEQYEATLKKALSRPPAFIAVQSGDVAELRRLLDAGYDINATIEDNRSLFVAAVESERLEIVETLLERGANVNARFGNDYDALFGACMYQNADLASLLMRHGADVNRRYTTRSSQGSIGNQTALSFAASKGCFEICKMLLEKGAELDVVTDAGYTPFMWALTNGASEKVALMLLEAGANPDPDITPRVSFGKKTSPMILASTNGMNAVVEALLSKKVRIDVADGEGRTALKEAAHHGHAEIVDMLIDAGADVNIADSEGWTPLIASVSKGHFDICHRLVDAGANLNAKGDNGVTALGQVIGVRLDRRVGDPMAALRRLFGDGDDSDSDENSEDEETLEMARFMLKKGASTSVTAGPDQELLADLASNQNDQSLLDLLVSFGAEVGGEQ
jgi:ankyrin repeat protein